MPREPKSLVGIDLEDTSGRFNSRPAVAILGQGFVEREPSPSPEDAVREIGLDWLLDDDAEGGLGRGEAHDGSRGRGAEAWVVVVQWVGEAISDNILELSVGYALTRVLDRLRRRRSGGDGGGEAVEFEVSRGAAALLAGVHVADNFDEEGPLEVEAVEEPSSIAGYEISELSYVGVEPWIVLLRNRAARHRYVVVVMPDGRVEGALRVPILPSEEVFILPAPFWPAGERAKGSDAGAPADSSG